MAQLAGDVDGSVEQLHKLPSHRQTQAQTSMTSRQTGFELPKALKNRLELLRSDSDTRVAHLDGNRQLSSVRGSRRGPNFHLTFLGELNSVSHQVPQNLAKMQRIADRHFRQAGVQRVYQAQPLRLRLGGELVQQASQRIDQRKLGLFQQHLMGGERRIFEGDVQDFEQVFRAKPGGPGILPLVVSESGLQQQVGHAQDSAQGCADLMIQARKKLPLYVPKLIGFQSGTACPLIGQRRCGL